MATLQRPVTASSPRLYPFPGSIAQLLGYTQNVLQTYAGAPVEQRDYRMKDGALVALG